MLWETGTASELFLRLVSESLLIVPHSDMGRVVFKGASAEMSHDEVLPRINDEAGVSCAAKSGSRMVSTVCIHPTSKFSVNSRTQDKETQN
jgi:hypothetical protein